jgi:2-amino-4-hydroxy-6-hydroxymethyldihydropteridine diphosphokinase
LTLITHHSSLITAFIALGSNLDDPASHVREAIADLARLPQTRVKRASALYGSAPVGYRDQPDFINAVAEIGTRLEPRPLLEALLEIEKRHGRVRGVRNGPRTLDLDIALYGERVVREPGLVVPHPRMHERAFVIVPLAEVAPGLDIPGFGSVSRLLERIDAGSVTRLADAPA